MCHWVEIFILSLQTKSVTIKKQMNKCIAEIQDQAGFEPRTPGRKAKTINAELKRSLPNAVD